MYQPDINTYLEAIKQQYEVLLQENKKLKLENKKLMETNMDYKRKVSYYKNIYKTTDILKLGSDWQVEGTKLYNIHQVYKMTFKDLYFSTVTNKGHIIFLSQNIIHIVTDNNLLILINDQFMPYDDFNTKKYKYSYDTPYIRYFIDDDDNLNIFSNNFLKKYDLINQKLLSTLNMPNHVGILVKSNLIYLTCYDKSFRIYDTDKLILILNSPEELRTNLILINNVGYSVSVRNNLVIFDIQSKSIKIVKLSVTEEIKRIYSIDTQILIKNGSSIVIYDTSTKETKDFDVDEDIKFLSVVDKFLLISNSLFLVVFDFRSKNKMYIKIKDSEILNVSSCGRNILVELPSSLRMYQYN